MSDKNTLISDIYELDSIKTQLEAVISNLKSSLEAIDGRIESKKAELLLAMKSENVDVNTDVDNVVAAIFRKENIGYTSDTAVLEYLKSIGRDDLIKVKTTESLDKVNLKKAIKADVSLSESLDSMTIRSTTEYVVVTSSENYQKMLEHINEGSKK